MGKVQELENIIATELERNNIELVTLQYRPENQGQMLRIFIDSDAGVDLDLCTHVTHILKPLIDESDYHYDYFEVSSPGPNRPLKKDKDFVRFQGYTVKVRMQKEYNGSKNITGVLMGANDKYLQVKVDDNILELPRDLLYTVRLHPDY